MLIICNAEKFLDMVFPANIKRKKFKGEVVIPIDGYGVLDVDYLFDTNQFFVFCLPGREDDKICIRKDLATFAVGHTINSLAATSIMDKPIENIDRNENEAPKKGRKKGEK